MLWSGRLVEYPYGFSNKDRCQGTFPIVLLIRRAGGHQLFIGQGAILGI
jgi:hypothetical protein